MAGPDLQMFRANQFWTGEMVPFGGNTPNTTGSCTDATDSYTGDLQDKVHEIFVIFEEKIAIVIRFEIFDVFN